MRIRSVTGFVNPGSPLQTKRVAEIGALLTRVKDGIQQAGYEVHTLRMATPPFPTVLNGSYRTGAEWARALTDAAGAHGVDYVSIGPALPDAPESYSLVRELLAVSPNLFASAVIAEKRRGISLAAARWAAETIVSLSTLESNGFANLRFTALACVPPSIPFFPAAYADGDGPAFALAIEAADLAVEAIAGASSLEAAGRALTASIEKHANAIAGAVKALREPAPFLGIDFSLAPFPGEACSLGAAFERLGVARIGLAGSALAAALLAGAIDAATFPRTGFCGLMLPPFEDTTLATRAADGSLTIRDLLLYSTLCGTGLDTIPLAGDTTPGQIAPVLLDVAALALRHGKPLTARLMPLPGKKAGEEAAFDFSFFTPTRVMALESAATGGLLSASHAEWLPIRERCSDWKNS
jgi:uncharacterized protein (UPF0210 family)